MEWNVHIFIHTSVMRQCWATAVSQNRQRSKLQRESERKHQKDDKIEGKERKRTEGRKTRKRSWILKNVKWNLFITYLCKCTFIIVYFHYNLLMKIIIRKKAREYEYKNMHMCFRHLMATVCSNTHWEREE